MRCAKCGTDNAPNRAVCSACGAQLSPPPPPSPASLRKKRPAWLIIVAIAGTLLLLAAICGLVALLLLVPTNTDSGDKTPPVSTERAGDGYNSPEKALDAEATNLLSGEWSFYTVDETDEYVEYWIGPKNEQFVKGIIVTKLESGKWVASDVYTLDLSQQASDSASDEDAGQDADADTSDEETTDETAEEDATPEEVAVWVVSEYLTAVGEGRGDDAFNLTTSPLSDAGPDSMTGDFEAYEIYSAETQDDGSIVVYFTLEWPDQTSDNGALVTTDAEGYMWVSDVWEAGD